jgi:hypothetical protein
MKADLVSEDKRHGLKELAALDLVIEGQKKGISVSMFLRKMGSAHGSITTLCDFSPLLDQWVLSTLARSRSRRASLSMVSYLVSCQSTLS